MYNIHFTDRVVFLVPQMKVLLCQIEINSGETGRVLNRGLDGITLTVIIENTKLPNSSIGKAFNLGRSKLKIGYSRKAEGTPQ